MKQLNLTVLNINHCCSYDNVYIQLKQFIKNLVLIDNYYNIVLTVTIRRVNNTSFLLINNLSIKPGNFDLLFKRIKKKLDLIDKNSIYSISFSINYSINMKYIYHFIITVFTSLIIIIIFYYLSHLFTYNGGEVVKETCSIFTDVSTNDSINVLDDSIKNIRERNFSVFNPFIDLFSKSNSIYNYFPSYFYNNKSDFLLNSFASVTGEAQDQSLITNVIRNETVSMVINKDYSDIKYDNYKYYCLLNDLSNIISEYIRSNK